MVYQWKTGSRIRSDAQKAGEVCESLRKTVGLTAESLLNASRAENSVLHGEFLWDNDAAAENYRLNQAAHIIRSIVIVPEKVNAAKESAPVPVRAYFPVSEAAGQYESIGVILRDEDKKKQMLETALSELRSFQKKYSALKEIAEPLNTPINALNQCIMEFDKAEGKDGCA